MTTIKTAIVQEIANPDNPYQATQVLQRGVDVFEHLVGKVSWVEMLLRLFREQSPTVEECQLLETLAVAVMNPGPRDNSVYAAMCGGAGQSSSAGCLTAAVLAGAGRHLGAREVFECMTQWSQRDMRLEAWLEPLSSRKREGVWPAISTPAGWDEAVPCLSAPLEQLLFALKSAGSFNDAPLGWCCTHYSVLSQRHQASCTLPLIASTVFHTLGLTAVQGEMLFILLRLPGAAAHSAEQASLNYRDFPFPTISYPREGV